MLPDSRLTWSWLCPLLRCCWGIDCDRKRIRPLLLYWASKTPWPFRFRQGFSHPLLRFRPRRRKSDHRGPLRIHRPFQTKVSQGLCSQQQSVMTPNWLLYSRKTRGTTWFLCDITLDNQPHSDHGWLLGCSIVALIPFLTNERMSPYMTHTMVGIKRSSIHTSSSTQLARQC